jgi:hypothetical protein
MKMGRKSYIFIAGGEPRFMKAPMKMGRKSYIFIAPMKMGRKSYIFIAGGEPRFMKALSIFRARKAPVL